MGDLRGMPEGEPVYLRDLDGTGSMHVCSQEDPGAVEYVPAPMSVAEAWQPIETAPKDGTCVLLYAEWSDDECGHFVGHFVDGHPDGPYGKFIWKEQSGASIVAERVVSHWMPLPEPPASPEGE